MMENLFQNLCPTPTFQNFVIRSLLSQEQLGQANIAGGNSSRLNTHMEMNDMVPDFETMSIKEAASIDELK